MTENITNEHIAIDLASAILSNPSIFNQPYDAKVTPEVAVSAYKAILEFLERRVSESEEVQVDRY